MQTIIDMTQTIIGFDNLAAGTVVTNQFQSQGVEFSGGTTRDDPSAPSARNVLQATDMDFKTLEFPIASVSGKFTDPHHSQVGVSVVLSQGAQFGGSATLVVYDINDNEIGRTLIEVPVGQHAKYDEIFSPAKNIARFKLSGGGNSSFVGLDNVTFDNLMVAQVPDFRLKYFGDVVRLIPGASSVGVTAGGIVFGEFAILVIRLNGSSGNIQISVTGLPPGVTVKSISPNPFNVGGTASFAVGLNAASGTFPVQGWNIHVIGTPSPSAGTVQRSISVPLSILDSYDAQIVGIEVTQGIQVYDLPRKPGNTFSQLPASYAWTGVDLAAGGKTKVRVFANIRSDAQPLNTNVPTIDCLLWGYRDRTELPGSPLSPENGFSLQPGLDFVEDSVRADPGNGFYFTLPPSWTVGKITLEAKIAPTPSFFLPENGDSNPENNFFILDSIEFTPTRDVWIEAFALRIMNPYDGGLYGPSAVLEEARNLLPIGEHQFYCSHSYSNTADITDIYNLNVVDVGFGRIVPVDDIYRAILVMARLRARADEFGFNQGFGMVVGIYTSAAGGMIRPYESRACTGPFWDCDRLSVAIFQDSGRPLSAAAHELGHLFGRKHASGACQASDPQDWPPDQMGFIQGVGLDRRTDRLLFPDRSGGNLGPTIYDFMGYCGQIGNNDADQWISVRGWNDTLTALAVFSSGSPAPLSAGSAKASSMRVSSDQQLIVNAVHDHSGNYWITNVAPGHVAPEECDPHSHYRLSVQDEDGAIVREAGMRVSRSHSEHGPSSQFLMARVAVPDVRKLGSVEITHKGKLVAKRVRSKELPVIKDIRVAPDLKTERGKRTVIKWNATHPEKKSLMAKVDFSSDGGKNWRPIYVGPNANEVALENSHFSASCEAIVRVRISDGFNESHAYSSCFNTAGSPPSVRIKSPAECVKIRCGTTVYLSGEAYDDTHQPIVGKQLVWTVGRRQVGTGATACISRLRPGIHNIRLTAVDAQKRATTKKTRLTVIA